MGWLIAVVVILGIIFFMIVSPGFRYSVLAGAALLGLIIYGNEQQSEKQQQLRSTRAAEEEAAQIKRNVEYEARSIGLIKAPDLLFTGASLTKAALPNEWRLAGTVQNKSQYALTLIDFLVSMQDCQPTCLTIGELRARTQILAVPAGQARAFEAIATFRDLPAAQSPKWLYAITAIYGIPPDISP